MGTPWERAQQASAGAPQPLPTAQVTVPTVDVPLPASGIAGAKAAAATQASLPITPSIADKVTSAAMWVTNTGLTTMAPTANSMVPGVNQSGAGGWEVAALGNGVLAIVQGFQTLSFRGHRFDRDRWGPWIIIILGLAICWFVWIWVPNQTGEPLSAQMIQKGILNGFATIYNGFSAFGPLSKLGVMSGQVKE